MSEQHTPGPWEFYPSSASTFDVCLPVKAGDTGGAVIATVFVGEDIAQLIAAAPDLLELALQYRNDLRYPPQGDSIQRRIERAERLIDKATGAASDASIDRVPG